MERKGLERKGKEGARDKWKVPGWRGRAREERKGLGSEMKGRKGKEREGRGQK